MSKKNGFTLIELLSVIIILSIILIIADVSLTKIKKDANVQEAKQIEKMLKKIGPDVYAYKGLGTYSVSELYSFGYLKNNNISNPSGTGECSGYLNIEKDNDTEEINFFVNLCCPGLYKTNNENYDGNCME